MKVITNSRIYWSAGKLYNHMWSNVSSSSVPYPDAGSPAYVSSTSYTINSKVTAAENIYVCIAPSSGYEPPARPDLWRCEGAAERYKMTDLSTSTKTTGTSPLTFTLSGNGVAGMNNMAFLNVVATSIQIVAVNAGVTVYSSTYSMAGKTDLVVTDLPGGNITVNVTITHSTNVSVGTCFWGKVTDIGMTQYGASAGIIDYSTRTTDIYGNATILQRTYAKRISSNLMIANTNIDSVFNFLATNRVVPMVWVGADGLYSSLIVYGMYKDFDINVAYPDYSSCSLTIEGLT